MEAAESMSNELEQQCRDREPLLAAYALGEPPDATLLVHLANCSVCQEQLRAYRGVARLLPYATHVTSPSPELRSRLLAAADRFAPPSAPIVPADARRRQWWRRPWVALGAACVAIVLMFAWNISLQRQLSEQRALNVASRERWVSVVEVLNAPDVQAFSLQGDEATGHLWITANSSVGCLVAQNLPVVPEQQSYHVWAMSGNTATHLGTLVGPAANAWVVLKSDVPISSYDRVIVTVESGSDNTAPTGQRVLEGHIAWSPEVMQ